MFKHGYLNDMYTRITVSHRIFLTETLKRLLFWKRAEQFLSPAIIGIIDLCYAINLNKCANSSLLFQKVSIENQRCEILN